MLVIFSIFVFSTPDTVHASWIKAYGISGSTGGGIGPTFDCNYLLWLTSGSGVTRTLQVSEFNSAGTHQWTKKITGTGENNLMEVPMEDGGYFVYGTKISTATGNDIVWEKFNSSWVKQYGNVFGGTKDESGGPNFTDDGGVLIDGTTKSYLADGSDQDMLLIKVSSGGTIEWNKAIHHGLKDGSPGITEVSDGYIFTASVQGDASEPTNAQQNILVVKIDKSGNRVWQKLFSGTAKSGTWVISLSAPQEVTGGYLLWGSAQGAAYDYYGDILLVKIDASGTILWKKKFTTGSDDLKALLYDVKENADGTLLVNGMIQNLAAQPPVDYNTTDAFLLKLSSTGSTISWQKKVGGPGYDILSLIEASDGDYILTGTSTSFGATSYDYDILYAKLGINLSTGALSFRFQKNFGSTTGMESGVLFDYLGQLMLIGMTNSWGPGQMNALGGYYLDANGEMDDCQYITDVTLTVATPTMAVSDATLTATNATLTDRSVGTPSDLSLTVATGTTPTKVDICEAATTGSYTIAGTITYNGSALSGVTVTLSGGTSKTTTTDEDGEYSFSDLSSSTYTITPSKLGYAFTPSSKQVTASCAVQLGVDFTATTSGTTYSISGKVTLSGSGLSGVTMTLSGSGSETTETDSSGDYTFSGLSNGTYTITPSKSGYTFTPVSKSVTISGSNKTGQNFTATAIATYSISGTVTLSGSGLSDVTMTLTGSGSGTTTTDTSGNYTFSGLSNGTYTVTPSKSGYTFTPTSKSVTISGSNKTGQNFIATQSTSGCSQWSDVIEKYNQYVGGQAGWADVISCYSDYVTP